MNEHNDLKYYGKMILFVDFYFQIIVSVVRRNLLWYYILANWRRDVRLVIYDSLYLLCYSLFLKYVLIFFTEFSQIGSLLLAQKREKQGTSPNLREKCRPFKQKQLLFLLSSHFFRSAVEYSQDHEFFFFLSELKIGSHYDNSQIIFSAYIWTFLCFSFVLLYLHSNWLTT